MNIKKIVISSTIALSLTAGIALSNGTPPVTGSPCITIKEAQKDAFPKMQCFDEDRTVPEYYKLCKGEMYNGQILPSDTVVSVNVCEPKVDQSLKRLTNTYGIPLLLVMVFLILIAEYRQIYWLKKIYSKEHSETNNDMVARN